MLELEQIINTVFPKKTVVIVGDLVADQFLSGTISRVSREAPVFIMRHEETVTLPGAAANAGANVASLGGTARLVGVVGRDENGGKLIDALKGAGVETDHVLKAPEISTTTKVRVLAGQQLAAKNQVIRIDYERAGELGHTVMESLREHFTAACAGADAIIISDYGYGAVFVELFEDALSISREKGIPVVVDSRYRLETFHGATSATPNREEVEAILGADFTHNECEALRKRLGYQSLVVTDGSRGMKLFEKDRAAVEIPAAGPTTAVDVTGAGDTVIAAYSLALASGMPFADAARIANHAGGVVVMKKRTARISPVELLNSIRDHSGTALSNQAK